MTWFRKGECSRLPAQHKKIIFYLVSVCVQWEYREWKYQKMSQVVGLAYRFSGVQSSSQVKGVEGGKGKGRKTVDCVKLIHMLGEGTIIQLSLLVCSLPDCEWMWAGQ